jgi:hypothetical protein
MESNAIAAGTVSRQGLKEMLEAILMNQESILCFKTWNQIEMLSPMWQQFHQHW